MAIGRRGMCRVRDTPQGKGSAKDDSRSKRDPDNKEVGERMRENKPRGKHSRDDRNKGGRGTLKRKKTEWKIAKTTTTTKDAKNQKNAACLTARSADDRLGKIEPYRQHQGLELDKKFMAERGTVLSQEAGMERDCQAVDFPMKMHSPDSIPDVHGAEDGAKHAARRGGCEKEGFGVLHSDCENRYTYCDNKDIYYDNRGTYCNRREKRQPESRSSEETKAKRLMSVPSLSSADSDEEKYQRDAQEKENMLLVMLKEFRTAAEGDGTEHEETDITSEIDGPNSLNLCSADTKDTGKWHGQVHCRLS